MSRKEAQRKPLENQKTAAWSNVKSKDDMSQVARPGLIGTIDAKEYADENQK